MDGFGAALERALWGAIFIALVVGWADRALRRARGDLAVAARALLVVVTAALAACAPAPKPVFAPLSYRSELPRVSVFPPAFVMAGHELIVVARPLTRGEVCLRVIDADAFAWHETCWEGGDSRRIPFRPMRPGRHIAYLAYHTRDAWSTSARDKAEFCALGEGADCP